VEVPDHLGGWKPTKERPNCVEFSRTASCDWHAAVTRRCESALPGESRASDPDLCYGFLMRMTKVNRGRAISAGVGDAVSGPTDYQIVRVDGPPLDVRLSQSVSLTIPRTRRSVSELTGIEGGRSRPRSPTCRMKVPVFRITCDWFSSGSVSEGQ